MFSNIRATFHEFYSDTDILTLVFVLPRRIRLCTIVSEVGKSILIKFTSTNREH